MVLRISLSLSSILASVAADPVTFSALPTKRHRRSNLDTRPTPCQRPRWARKIPTFTMPARSNEEHKAASSRRGEDDEHTTQTPDRRYREQMREGRLEVDLSDADVILETASGSMLDVRAYVNASDREWAAGIFEDMDFSVTERGNTVYVEAGGHNISDREWRGHRSLSVTVVVAVPKGTDIIVLTDDGDIHTSDGDIVVDRLESRRAKIRTC